MVTNARHRPSSTSSDGSPGKRGGRQRAFHLRVSEDKLTVWLDCALPEGGDWKPLLDRVQTELSELGVAEAPTRETFEKILQSAASGGEGVTELTLVKGEEPVAPRDGVVEWEQDFFNPGFAVDEKTGAVDYRRRMDHRTVAEGQLLARLIKPLFWDAELKVSDFTEHPSWILRRVLSFGDAKTVAAVRAFFGDEAIRDAVRRRGIDVRTRNYWKLILDDADAS